MALSPPERPVRALLLALTLAGMALAAPPQAQCAGSRATINIQSQSGGTFDFDNDRSELTNVRLWQDNGTVIEAQSAVATGARDNFANSRWEFKGGVRIQHDGMTLQADSATAAFVNSSIATIHVSGSPAKFSRPAKDPSRPPYRGQASTIYYDAATTNVRFAGKTRWFDGSRELQTDELVYTVRDNSFSAAGPLDGILSGQAGSRGTINIQSQNGGTFHLDNDRSELAKVRIWQDNGTVIEADKAVATRTSDSASGSQWEFNGKVHIEFDGMTLDADSAETMFADGELSAARANGGPARFWRRTEGSNRVYEGRAQAIQFDGTARTVHFSGGTWWSDGLAEVTIGSLTYGIRDNSVSSGETGQNIDMVIRTDRRVPAPRLPDRVRAP